MSRVDLAELRTLRAKIEKRGADPVNNSESDSYTIVENAQQDIARTPGGRDDVELTIQFLQLLHGASLPTVRCGNTYEAIAALEQAGCLTHQESTLLLANYARLCRLQHQLSMMFDRAGRQLPQDSEAKRRLAWHLGIRSEDGSEGDLDRFQRLLADTFAKNRKVIDHLMLDAPSSDADVAVETELLLDPEPDPREVETTLRQHGLTEPYRAMDNLRALATETVPFLSHHRCRHFLSSIAPALLEEISRTPNPDQALSSLETVADSLGAKATLWELLAGSRPTMKLMVRLCATAPYLTEILTNNPGMIDELIDSLLMNRLPSAQRLDAHSIELCRGATDIDRILHSFKSSSHLTIGVRDILGKESLEATHQAIGDTAEACLRRVIEYEQELLAEQFGDPVDSDGNAAELIMLALGKLGGREPNYHSDIDAVFLYTADGQTQRRVGGHRATLTNQLFFNQLAQRVITRVNDSSKMRRLYELDSRMRPSDEEGGWAVSTDSFFQAVNQPTTPLWQRLDLCRARPISGSRLLRQQIETLVEETIVSSIWKPEMAQEVRTIRHRMEQTAHEDNLKRGVGGTVDVELVAQSLTLQYAKDFPQIIQRGTTATLAALAETGCLEEKDSLGLINGYRTLRRIEANLRLMNTPARHELPTSEAGEMKNLAYLMNESDPSMIIAQCQQARQSNRAIFDQVFKADV
jgi:glutamate-ammonia-ligase adenylyltransferase